MTVAITNRVVNNITFNVKVTHRCRNSCQFVMPVVKSMHFNTLLGCGEVICPLSLHFLKVTLSTKPNQGVEVMHSTHKIKKKKGKGI